MMLCAAAGVSAQDCYTTHRSKGIELYNSKRYDEAISQFNFAMKCAPRTHDLDRLIQRCIEGKKSQARKKAQEAAANENAAKPVQEEREETRQPEVEQPAPTVQEPEPEPEPEVKIISSRYEGGCNQGRAGSTVTSLICVKNMKGQRVKARCYMAPERGGAKAMLAYDINGKYTVYGGKSGQEKEFAVDEDEVFLTATFFVPYNVMDFKGNYAEQPLKADLYVFQETVDPKKENMNIIPGGEAHEYFPMHPVSIMVNGSSNDIDLPVDYEGGVLDLNIAACSDEVKWSEMPAWIRVDAYGIHIEENNTPTTREAVVTVSSSEGGAPIAIKVKQEGVTADKIEVKINQVKFDEHVVDNSYGAEVLRAHISVDIKGAHGRTMKAFLLFYAEDGTTPLVDKYGKEVKGFGMGSIPSNNAWFDDFVVRAYYNHFVNAVNVVGTLTKVYVAVSFDDGETFVARSGPYTIAW